MKAAAWALLVTCALAAACAPVSGPPVVISGIRILAPLPGSEAGVAYLRITNNGDQPVTIKSIRSPQFESVMMHETTLVDGVARMRPLDEIEIGASESVEFAEGGKHLMLMRPGADTAPGSPVTLEFTYDDSLLVVSAVMQTRLPAE